jgi:hypothetical protein
MYSHAGQSAPMGRRAGGDEVWRTRAVLVTMDQETSTSVLATYLSENRRSLHAFATYRATYRRSLHEFATRGGEQ